MQRAVASCVLSTTAEWRTRTPCFLVWCGALNAILAWLFCRQLIKGNMSATNIDWLDSGHRTKLVLDTTTTLCYTTPIASNQARISLGENMLHKLKQTFITLGLASGMTAGALFYLHNVDTCRVMVLKDLHKQRMFQNELASYSETTDFLTALTRGK